MKRKRLSVLVVDDEREIRQLLIDILEDAGHEVTCVPDGASARMLLAETHRRFDLALVDYLMPGEDGLSLIRRLREIRPDLVTVLLTGDTAITGVASPEAGGPHSIITKPFGLSAVEEFIAGLMAEPAP